MVASKLFFSFFSSPRFLGLCVCSHLKKMARELVFPSKKGMPLSDPFRRTIQIMQCQVDRKYLDPQEFDDAGNPRGIVPHGFRATFKTYMSERSRFDTMAIERCMQHKPQNPLDKNYMRSSMLEIRLEAMNEWAAFCTTESR